MDREIIANIKNPEELQAYIQNKVEEEIRLKHFEIKDERTELEKQKVNIAAKLKKVEENEKKLEAKVSDINEKIKVQIEKQERVISEKKKDLERKLIENEKQLERKFADKERELENKEKNINKKALETESKMNAELQRREREIERKRIIEERKIPNIVQKAQDEIRVQKKMLEDEKKKIEKKLFDLKRKQKEVSKRESDVNRREDKHTHRDENTFVKSRIKKEDDDSDSWLTTYSDVITLLLTLFVFMFTVAKVDTENMEELQAAINIALLKKSGDQILQKGDVREPVFATMKKKLQNIFKENNVSEHVSLTVTDDGVKLELASSAVYDLGSANIKREMEPVLGEISGILLGIDNGDISIEVEGHTDNIPINTIQFPSNWELSANRATNIVKFFIEKGVNPQKLRASGFADSRPKVPNVDKDGKSIPANQAKNRRVEIYIGKPR